jgi:hypothetical protein
MVAAASWGQKHRGNATVLHFFAGTARQLAAPFKPLQLGRIHHSRLRNLLAGGECSEFAARIAYVAVAVRILRLLLVESCNSPDYDRKHGSFANRQSQF